MKTYKLELVVQEGYDEFWEGLKNEHKTGCDEIVQIVGRALSDAGIVVNHESTDDTLRLIEFKDN